MKIVVKKKPYHQRSDVNKVKAQWHKLTGLHGRDEPSAALVRAATAVELAVNFAIRSEFADQSELSNEAVDMMLRKANGLHSKMQNLLIPLTLGRENQAVIKALLSKSNNINETRNKIVHGGYFSTRKDAIKKIEECRSFILDLVKIYKPKFKLSPLATNAIDDDETTPKAEIEIDIVTARTPKDD